MSDKEDKAPDQVIGNWMVCPETLSKLIDSAMKLREIHGDIPVRVQTLTHLWKPELVIVGEGEGKYLLLNG